MVLLWKWHVCFSEYVLGYLLDLFPDRDCWGTGSGSVVWWLWLTWPQTAWQSEPPRCPLASLTHFLAAVKTLLPHWLYLKCYSLCVCRSVTGFVMFLCFSFLFCVFTDTKAFVSLCAILSHNASDT